jgi:hypothetical protein
MCPAALFNQIEYFLSLIAAGPRAALSIFRAGGLAVSMTCLTSFATNFCHVFSILAHGLASRTCDPLSSRIISACESTIFGSSISLTSAFHAVCLLPIFGSVTDVSILVSILRVIFFAGTSVVILIVRCRHDFLLLPRYKKF